MSTSQRESTPQEMDTILETDHIEEMDHIQERVHVTKRSNKRAKSSVWDHFTKIKVGEGKYQDATCNHCGKKLAWSNAKGTSSMKKHIENNSCRKFNYNPYTSPRSQQVFDQDKSRRDFAVAVAKHNYPFNMSEHEYFGVYIKGLNPYALLPSRNTIKADVNCLYGEERERIYSLLDSLDSKVSLTTDLWTSDHSGKPYCCLTAHYIDSSWELNKIVIAFKILPYPHDGDNIFSFLKARILEWNLDRKLCSVVVDNATANTSMISKLKEWLYSNSMISYSRDLLHVRCSAHILNLVVQDGISAIRGYLVNIRKITRYLERNPIARQNFDLAKQQLRLQDLRDVAMDVQTRWNSTFELLETAIPLKEVFERFALTDKKCARLNPSAREWEDAKVILECLRVFYDVTKQFSGSKYPTSNIFFPLVCEVKLKLMEMENSEHYILRDMFGPMNEKFDKYWEECKSVLSIAVVFDPRYKMHIMRYFFTQLYGDDGGADEHVDKVRRSLDDLYIRYGGTLVPSVSESASGSSSRPGIKTGYLNKFNSWYDKSHEPSVQNELEIYLNEPIIPQDDDFDVLKWWSINSKRLPILSMIARDILAVPATTVASESAFSLGGRIIDEERSQLGAEVVESLVTLNDWIPPINKTSRQSKPMIGEEVLESESDLEEFDDDSCED